MSGEKKTRLSGSWASAEKDINFSNKTKQTDLALVVEGKKLYVSKLVLSLTSSVFDQMLNSNFKEQAFARCLPVLRDSIVFYSKEDKIVGILQICFSCWWIKNEEEEDFEVDYKIFPILKDKLIQIGHRIKNE